MSESEDQRPAASHEEAHSEAQRAADELKSQIAAVRRRIQDAKDTLQEHARREREPKSFKR
jgi:hypothetical protein